MFKKNIKVSLISPGFIKTPMTDKNDFPMPMIKSPEYAADQIYNGLIKKNNFEIHFPKAFTYFLKLLRILPNNIYFKLINIGNIYMKRDK
jgi:short-subunit dehydrogenase